MPDLITAARAAALAIIAQEIVNNDALSRILSSRVDVLFDGYLSFERALEELEADAESAGGARRHVLMIVHDRLNSPLWQLEVSCSSSPPSSATQSSPRR